jgi:hypothetical protein
VENKPKISSNFQQWRCFRASEYFWRGKFNNVAPIHLLIDQDTLFHSTSFTGIGNEILNLSILIQGRNVKINPESTS